MKIFLALALLFCPLPGLAGDAAGPATGEPGATAATKKAHPDLFRLEQELSRKLDDKKDGRVTPEQYQAWKGEFRARLDAAIARVPPSPDNTATNARIMAQLGEGEAAHAALDQALEQNPKSPVLLATKGQVLYDQKDFPGAAHNALQAWENSGRTDKGAWALYQMSKGRGSPSGTASVSPGLSPVAQGLSVVSEDDSNKPIKLAVKGSALPSAVPVPGQDGGDPIKHEGGLPLWPLAVPFAGGLIAYGLYRAKQNDGGSDLPVDEKKTAFMPAAVATSGPAAEVVKEALRKGAQRAATSAIGAITITAATFGLIVGAGVATIYGLNQMIEAQDKYNEAIDTHRDDQLRSVIRTPAAHGNEVPENTEVQPQTSSSGGSSRRGGGAGTSCTVPKGLGNIGGGNATVSEILKNAERWLGPGYKQVGPGRYRSADNTRQFRMRDGDLSDPKQGEHVHFECIGPNGRDIVENSHVRILD